MRQIALKTFATALILSMASLVDAQTPPKAKAKPEAPARASTSSVQTSTSKEADGSVPYPTEVALVNEAPKGFTYRQSPERLPLYTWDKDGPGKSNCYEGCDTEWIPLLAPAEAKPLGEWSLVPRKDGKHQWAYRKRPVYMLIHDSAEAPIGDGTNGEWHLLPHFQ
jgi:predicted lipoprotein with Yx(FWY)xxD motif